MNDVVLTQLDGQRAHVLGILEGLSEEQLLRPVLPSGWTCAGMVQHLTVDVERFWFRGVMAADPEAVREFDGPPRDAWSLGVDVSAASALGAYRREIDAANAVVARTAASAPPAWWPGDVCGDWRFGSLAEVVAHVLTETATHAGHLDAARELLDGRQWLVLD